MAKITPGNRLYFYQLFSRKIGAGKQVPLARVEELLAAEDVWLEDVECASVQELLEALGDIVRLTVFKKGRMYMTLQRNADLDAILERSSQKAEKKPASGAKSFKHKKSNKDPKPAKPRHKKPAKRAQAVVDEPVAAPELEPEPALTPEPEPAPAPEPVAEPEPAPAPEPVAEPELATAPEPIPTPTPVPQGDLPQHFSTEVACKDAVLRLLYQMLPPNVEPMAVLDEDWRVARSVGTVGGNRSRVTFPLRYLREDGSTPIEVTLRRAGKSVGGATPGKRWSLALVDGDDGSGTAHEGIALEGLPMDDEGAWSDLSAPRSAWANASVSPLRQMAQTVALGPWESLLGSLATMAAPERWDYPGEGVGKPSRYGILREYITVTFSRITAQGKLSHAADGSLSAFNTGLLTPFAEDIYAVLTPRKGDIPWQLAGFCTAGAGELGTRLLAIIDPLPEPATYLQELRDITPETKRMVVLNTEALLGRQLGRLPRAWLDEQLANNAEASELLAQVSCARPTERTQLLSRLAHAIKADPGLHRRINSALDDAARMALRRARASYRLASPAWDPEDGRTKLLLPLCLVSDAVVDCALVLDQQASGNYLAASILPLARAYACARIVCADQPSWLAPTSVL